MFSRLRDAVGQANRWVKDHFVGMLTLVVALGLLFPDAGMALKHWELFQVPGTQWHYDFPTFALTLMMVAASINCRVEEFRLLAVKRRAGLNGLLVMYVLVPALSMLASVTVLGLFVGPATGELQLGLVLVAFMPVAMTSSLWVKLNGGNVPLLLAVLALTTGLAVVTIPLYVGLLPGMENPLLHVPYDDLMKQLVLSVTLPLLLGIGLRRKFPRWIERAQPYLSFISSCALLLLLATNVALAKPHIAAREGSVLLATAAVTVALNLAAYWVGIATSRSFGLLQKDAVTLTFATGMRSTGTAMVIGMTSFPLMPLVTVPAAIYSISQQLIAGWLTRSFQRSHGGVFGRALGRERRDLLLEIARLYPAYGQSESGLSLLVFRLSGGDSVARKGFWEKTVALHRLLRCNDYFCLLPPDSFAVLCFDTPLSRTEAIIRKIRHAVPADFSLRCGVSHSTSVDAALQLLDSAHSAANDKQLAPLELLVAQAR